MNLLLRVLQLWLAWVLPRPRLVLGIAFVTALASVAVTASRLEVQTDQLELISDHHPLISLSKRLEAFNFDGRAVFTVVVEAPSPARGIDFASNLAGRIEADRAHFDRVIYHVDPNAFKRWALLYLDEADLHQIRDNVSQSQLLLSGLAKDPELLSLLRLVNQEMASRMVGELFTGFLDEPPEGKPAEKPMDLSFLLRTLEGMAGAVEGSGGYTSPWSAFFKNANWDLKEEGYFWEGGKRYLLMFVIPARGGSDFTDEHDSLDVLRVHLKEALPQFSDVRAGVTGQEALNNDEMTTAVQDMNRATWISLLGILLLMVFFLGGLRRPVVEMVALGVGLCWTFGWTTLFIGHLNMLSVVFAPLLCGLGVDYGIHWFARFEEEESDPSLETRSVITRINDRSGPGILLAGLSAAFSFLPFVLTGFRALIELGLITGMGILFTLFADFSVLPALSVLVAKRRKAAPLALQKPHRDLLRLGPKSALLVLLVAVLLCLLSAWGAARVRFDLNPLRLQSSSAESVAWEKRLLDHSDRSLLSAAVFAGSPAEVEKKTEAMKALPAVGSIESAFTLLPQNQEAKIPIIASFVPLVPALNVTSQEPVPDEAKAFSEILERIRFKMQDDQASQWGAERPLVEQMTSARALCQRIVDRLRNDPSSLARLDAFRAQFRSDLISTWDFIRQPVPQAPMRVEDLPEVIRSQFFRDGQYVVRIYPRGSIWEQEALSPFVKQIQSVDPEAVGDPVSLYVFASAFKRACILASVYAIVAIFILLYVTFRGIVLSVLALVPLLVGTLWTVGIMGFVGQDFNLANSIFMPLVVGAGIEYGVIILNRWREGRMRPGHLPHSTGKGVILAALTTTLGFGTLMVSHHRGIFSLGFVAWAGSLCVLIAAVVLLPAILGSFYRQAPAVEVVEKERTR